MIALAAPVLDLVRGEGAELKRVHPVRHLLGEEGIDGALPLDPSLAGKSVGDDLDPKMGLTALARAGMSGVAVGLIDDSEAAGRESGLEFCADAIGH